MVSEKVQAKAAAYLLEGKVKVLRADEDFAEVEVQGSDSTPYVVKFQNWMWFCDCPAKVDCAHLIAAQTVSPLVNDHGRIAEAKFTPAEAKPFWDL